MPLSAAAAAARVVASRSSSELLLLLLLELLLADFSAVLMFFFSISSFTMRFSWIKFLNTTARLLASRSVASCFGSVCVVASVAMVRAQSGSPSNFLKVFLLPRLCGFFFTTEDAFGPQLDAAGEEDCLTEDAVPVFFRPELGAAGEEDR